MDVRPHLINAQQTECPVARQPIDEGSTLCLPPHDEVVNDEAGFAHMSVSVDSSYPYRRPIPMALLKTMLLSASELQQDRSLGI